MGIAAGGNINPKGVSMFEPMGGSTPKYTGKGVVSPLAAIAACQMMLDYLGEEKAAGGIEEAMMKVVGKGCEEPGCRQDGIHHLPGRRPGGPLSLRVINGLWPIYCHPQYPPLSPF